MMSVVVLCCGCINHAATIAPVLLGDATGARGIVVEAINHTREPFAFNRTYIFGGSDTRTRLTLFAANLDLLPNEDATLVLAAEAEDGARRRHPLKIEYVGVVPGVDWLSSIVVRLDDDMDDIGDVLIGVALRGVSSNRVRVGVGHIGGGPPDDVVGAPATLPDLGANASLHGKRVFPVDNAWNEDISNAQVDPNSTALIASMGVGGSLHPDFGTTYNGAPNGIPYVVVAGTQTKAPINFTDYGGESNPGPYPVPPDAPVEGGPQSNGDRHVIVIDRDNWKLYELFAASLAGDGRTWNAASGAVFDLNSNALRPAGWTSADAAGLPIFPGLVRYDEVFERGEINHALRFTAQLTRRAYVAPARHFASNSIDPNRPPMGMRVRLKASFDVSPYSPAMRVILTALKKYGMILADNGASWFISGAPDPRWNDDELHTLTRLKGADFEVVKMGAIVTQ